MAMAWHYYSTEYHPVLPVEWIRASNPRVDRLNGYGVLLLFYHGSLSFSSLREQVINHAAVSMLKAGRERANLSEFLSTRTLTFIPNLAIQGGRAGSPL